MIPAAFPPGAASGPASRPISESPTESASAGAAETGRDSNPAAQERLPLHVHARGLALGGIAIVAGLLHIMPYFGPLLITSATGLVAFLQFESLQMVLLVAGASLGIATLVGTFVTTWMTGRIARMNPAAVFVSLLFRGWLWGVWGLLLGVPVIVIVKVVAERVEGMEIVAELLGE